MGAHTPEHGAPNGGTHGAGQDHGAAQHAGHGGGHAALQGQQRTRFVDVIRGSHTKALHGVDFHVGVGTIIPDHYHFYPLPPELIEVVPEYRGYDYIIVDDAIIILEPGTRRIVDIIEE